MKKLAFFYFFILFHFSFAQIPDYYNDVDLTKRGMDLFDELAVKISVTHDSMLSYSQLWDVLKFTDEVASDTSKVFLIYGWENGSDSDCHNDIMRDKDQNGGSSSACEWNREHVFPRSLGDPDLGNTGAGADAHHVRPSDVGMNGWRGNKKFIDGSGVAGEVNTDYWYPGDEWKGDVARIIMYLYARYGSQCLPRYVGEGNPVSNDPDMVDLFLEWNAEDPPSALEIQRNNRAAAIQGNRNPFIDNPYLATLIWGGTPAQDNWNMSVSTETVFHPVKAYPNPVSGKLYGRYNGHAVWYVLTTADGKIIRKEKAIRIAWDVAELPRGIYFLYVRDGKWINPQKIIKQ